jgi:transposase
LETQKKNPQRQRAGFCKEFKLEAVQLLEPGQKPAAQRALELGVKRNQLCKWQEQLNTHVPARSRFSMNTPSQRHSSSAARKSVAPNCWQSAGFRASTHATGGSSGRRLVRTSMSLQVCRACSILAAIRSPCAADRDQVVSGYDAIGGGKQALGHFAQYRAHVSQS